MKGKPITTPEELMELANNKKSILITTKYNEVRLPASTLLYRQFRETFKLLTEGYVFEYIIEPKRKFYYKPKQKLKEDWHNETIKHVDNMLSKQRQFVAIEQFVKSSK